MIKKTPTVSSALVEPKPRSGKKAVGAARRQSRKYTGRRGSWYLVLTSYIWAAQPSYPYPDNDLLAANQDPYGQSQRGTLCQAGVDNYGD